MSLFVLHISDNVGRNFAKSKFCVQYKPFVTKLSRIRANSYALFLSPTKTHEFRVQNHIRICIQIHVRNQNKRKKFVREISEIRARILNKERNLCTNVNKPTRLHQDRRSKTSSFDNYMVNLKSKFIKIISKFSTYNCICKDHSSLVCKLCLFVYLKFSL